MYNNRYLLVFMSEKIKKRWQKNKKWLIAISLLLINIFVFLPRFLPSQALTSNIYSTDCSGDWFGADRVLGQPDVSVKGSFEDFNTENSAFYKSGFQSILCQDFNVEELKEKHKFVSARIGLSLAINEIFNEIQVLPTSNVTSTSEEIIQGKKNDDSIGVLEVEKQKLENDGQKSSPENQPEALNEKQNGEEDKKQEEAPLKILLDQLFLKHNLFLISSALAQGEEATVQENISEQVVIVEPEKSNVEEINSKNLEPEVLIEPDEPSSTESDEENLENGELEIITPLLNEDPSVLIEDDLIPVFLPPEAREQANQVAEPEAVVNHADAILNLNYLLADKSYFLRTFSVYPDSPLINGGYFYFDLPEVRSFDDLGQLKISLEGLLDGNPRLIAYLDSLWIEITYEDELIVPELTASKSFDGNDWEIFTEYKNRIYQITNNDFDDKFPMVDGKNIVWQSQIDGKWHIFWLNFDNFLNNPDNPDLIVQLSDSETNNISPKIYNDQVIWQSWIDGNWEIMTVDVTDLDRKVERLTETEEHETGLNFLDGEIIWERKIEGEKKIFRSKKTEESWQIEEIFDQKQ